jgi:hypothetical protein
MIGPEFIIHGLQLKEFIVFHVWITEYEIVNQLYVRVSRTKDALSSRFTSDFFISRIHEFIICVR